MPASLNREIPSACDDRRASRGGRLWGRRSRCSPGPRTSAEGHDSSTLPRSSHQLQQRRDAALGGQANAPRRGRARSNPSAFVRQLPRHRVGSPVGSLESFDRIGEALFDDRESRRSCQLGHRDPTITRGPAPAHRTNDYAPSLLPEPMALSGRKPRRLLSSLLASREGFGAGDRLCKLISDRIDAVDATDLMLQIHRRMLRGEALAGAESVRRATREGRSARTLDGIPVTIKRVLRRDARTRDEHWASPSWRGARCGRGRRLMLTTPASPRSRRGGARPDESLPDHALYRGAKPSLRANREPVVARAFARWLVGRRGGCHRRRNVTPRGRHRYRRQHPNACALLRRVRAQAHARPTPHEGLPERARRARDRSRHGGADGAGRRRPRPLLSSALDPRRLAALDPRVPPAPWDDPEGVRIEKLRVGYYVDDGVLPASKAIVRAVERAVEALRARGATLVPFDPPDVRAMLSIYLGVLSADGGAALVAALAGGEVDPVLEPLRRIAAIPATARRVLARTARALGQANLALMLEAMGDKTASELWALTGRLGAYRAELLSAMDLRRESIFLVCPRALHRRYRTSKIEEGFSLASSYTLSCSTRRSCRPRASSPSRRVLDGETTRTGGVDLPGALGKPPGSHAKASAEASPGRGAGRRTRMAGSRRSSP